VRASLITACEANGLLKEGQQQVTQTISSGLSAGIKNPFPDLPDELHKSTQEQQADASDHAQVEENTRPNPLLSGFIFDGDMPPTPPAQLVKRLIPKQGICFIGGQSGAGKTFVAVDLAVSLASGSSFFSHPTLERVGVVILAAEGAQTFASRIEVAKDQKAPGNLLPIAWLADVPNLAQQRGLREIINRLKAVDALFRDSHTVRLGAVICDTLAACFAIDDENDNSKAAAVIRHLKELSDRLNVVVIPVHHHGKLAETGLRGASAWHAGSDVVLSVLADRNQLTGVCENRRLRLAKSRSDDED
ncbi:MAG: ATP-binding protein, partial [Methylocystis sp.]